MHVIVQIALIATTATLPLAAQLPCKPSALTDAAQATADVRHTLHSAAVAEQDPTVPAAVAAQLAQLKDALTQAADAAFACSAVSTSPDPLQTTLVSALHANLALDAESSIVISGNQDVGAYGSDLSVQVFQLTNAPRFYEVDFRYGIECGDDNLLLVYEANARGENPGWQRRLRWDAPTYHTVADAFGDFIMLTPLTGDFRHPTWRFLVAHGRPGCAPAPRLTHFDLDLLTPAADSAQPTLTWHFDHSYTQVQTTQPRLATTDDTVDFRLQAGDPQSARTPAKSSAIQESYRFRLTGNGQMEPLPAGAPETSQPAPSGARPTTSSPQ